MSPKKIKQFMRVWWFSFDAEEQDELARCGKFLVYGVCMIVACIFIGQCQDVHAEGTDKMSEIHRREEQRLDSIQRENFLQIQKIHDELVNKYIKHNKAFF